MLIFRERVVEERKRGGFVGRGGGIQKGTEGRRRQEEGGGHRKNNKGWIQE